MQRQKSYDLNFIIGIIIILVAIIDLIFGILKDPLEDLLWFSNTILFLLGFAFIFKSKLLMGSVLILSIVELFWLIDFLGNILIGRGIFGGTTDYMFSIYGINSFRFYIELDHTLVFPLSIYGTYKIGLHNKSYILSSAYAIILNTLTFFFTPLEKNINCIQRLCFLKENPFKVSNKLYFIIWTLFLCITAYFLNKVMMKINKIKK